MSELDSKLQELEGLKLEEEVQGKKTAIAKAKRELGPDWKQTLKDAGVSLWKYVTSPEARQSLRNMAGGGQELRDLSKIPTRRLR